MPNYTQEVALVVCQKCGEHRIDEAWRGSNPKSWCSWCKHYGPAVLKEMVPRRALV